MRPQKPLHIHHLVLNQPPNHVDMVKEEQRYRDKRQRSGTETRLELQRINGSTQSPHWVLDALDRIMLLSGPALDLLELCGVS